MSRVHCLEQVIAALISDFSHDDSVRAAAETIGKVEVNEARLLFFTS